jgi:uncharacterized membrane protein
MNLMTSSFLKANARELIRVNMPKLIIVGIVYIIAITIVSTIQSRLSMPAGHFNDLMLGNITIEQYFDSISTFGIFLATILGLMLPTITIGYDYYCIKITRKLEGDYKDLQIGFSMFIKVISISFLSSLFIMLWALLFIAPGIAAYYRYRQAYYILLDDPTKSAMDCIRESKLLMNGKKLDLFLIDISFLGWVMLSVTVQLITIFPIVSIWLTPYYGLTLAAYYNGLIKNATV